MACPKDGRPVGSRPSFPHGNIKKTNKRLAKSNFIGAMKNGERSMAPK